jgi:hypothetical protein
MGKIRITMALLLAISFTNVTATAIDLVTPREKATIVYAPGDHTLDSIAANLLADDIQRVTGYRPRVTADVIDVSGNAILIGSIGSALMKQLGDPAGLRALAGKWECYQLKVLDHPLKRIAKALVITGSDARGMAYGVFDISARIGVSPWYWWADVVPARKDRISLEIRDTLSSPPSVKYRGIFINDEDWGLQPWAAKTFEPATGDIGPKTYARVFELLLRLKANLLWPAMHPSTRAFYYYPGNAKMAADYEVVIGSSHAEPMLRNNVSEWDKTRMGDFNYVTNRQKVYEYWEERVKESRRLHAMYSLGMRGIHDSGIEGVKSNSEAVPLLQNILSDQRDLLRKYIDSDLTRVPQIFTAYKEVLDIYDSHLRLPGDVTLVWPDDNYGYIRRLDDSLENLREGGAGIYYHVSYWGRPHDYLWLSTTHPALIREEMTKAYTMNARNVWVLNVGDIKPAEYNIQLFMDMAWHIEPFADSRYSRQHLVNWFANLFGTKYAPQMAALSWEYYGLAFERRPEFMGWSQTEPTTEVKMTAYDHDYYGDQAQQRIDRYNRLAERVMKLAQTLPGRDKAAFYELVRYPVVCAALMNEKFLYRDKAILYAKEGRLSARYFAQCSRQAYAQIVAATNFYNHKLAGGKWAGIMSMHPRNLPVFKEPVIDTPAAGSAPDSLAGSQGISPVGSRESSLGGSPVGSPEVAWRVSPEGSLPSGGNRDSLSLPIFDRSNGRQHFIDLFLTRPATVAYTVIPTKDWISVSQTKGILSPSGDHSQQRIRVQIDWKKISMVKPVHGQNIVKPSNGQIVTKPAEGQIIIRGAGKEFRIRVRAEDGNNGYISLFAADYRKKVSAGEEHWEVIDGLGSTGRSLEVLPLKFNPPAEPLLSAKNRPVAEYDFSTSHTSPAGCMIYTLPTSPLNKHFGMRYAVSVDDGEWTVLDAKTSGRSEEWKQNVLSNSAVREVRWASLPAGRHRLKIYGIDPGLILDRILIDLGGLRPFYGLLPETKIN